MSFLLPSCLLRNHKHGSRILSFVSSMLLSPWDLNPSHQPSEKAMAPHSSTLAWKIPWMEEPGGLQSMGSLRVRHDWATSIFTFMHWRRKWQPLQCSCLENPRDGGAWWAAISGVAQSRTRLKRLSSSSSSSLQTSWELIVNPKLWINISPNCQSNTVNQAMQILYIMKVRFTVFCQRLHT